MKVRYRINHKDVTKAEFDAHPPIASAGVSVGPSVGQHFSDSTPRRSYSMGVAPGEQLDKARELLRQHNITGVKYDEKGNCFVTDKRDRGRFARVFGEAVGLGPLHDADSFNSTY